MAGRRGERQVTAVTVQYFHQLRQLVEAAVELKAQVVKTEGQVAANAAPGVLEPEQQVKVTTVARV